MNREWPSFVAALAAGAVGSVAAWGFLVIAGQGDHPYVLIVGAVAVAAVVWMMAWGMGDSTRVGWPAERWEDTHTPTDRTLTKRLDQLNAAASGGRASIAIADILYDVATARLIERHGADPEAPLADTTMLSPGLLRVLQTCAINRQPMRIPARNLALYLKEIDHL